MSLRARFVAYLVVVHLLMAGVAWFVVAQNRFYLIAVEAVLAVSFLTGLALTRRFFESLEFVRQSAQLLEDSDFMSRVREVKQADVDRLIQVYNRMVDALRGERVRLQEQQHFLARVLRESPGGIVVLDFDGRVTLANPAAERLLQAPGETLTGAELADAGPRPGPRPDGAGAGRPARARRVGRTSRAGAARDLSRSRLPPQLLPARGAHRRVAALREGGLREADSDAVARGEQHGGRLELTAQLLPDLRRAAPSARPRRLSNTRWAWSSHAPSS